MSPETAVGELFTAFAARDAARMEDLLHPDCTFWAEGTATAAGRDTPYTGAEGVRIYLEDADRAWEHLEVQPQDVRSAGDGVICFGVAIGRRRGEQEEQRIPVIWVFRLREGRIVYARAARTAAEARVMARAEGGGNSTG